MQGNIPFFKLWNIAQRCFHCVGTMEDIYPTALNWSDIESIARINKIKLNRILVNKLSVAERLSIEESHSKKR